MTKELFNRKQRQQPVNEQKRKNKNQQLSVAEVLLNQIDLKDF